MMSWESFGRPVMLDVLGGDYVGVLASLIRPGYPMRIDCCSQRAQA